MHKAKLLLVFTLFFIGYTTTFAQSKYPSILWEIKKGNDKPSYLFGTYHISSKGVFKLGDSIFYALKNVDIVAKELNANTWQKEQYLTDEMEDSYAKYTNSLAEREFKKGTLNITNTVMKLPTFISIQPSFVNYFLSRSNGADGYEEEMFLDKFISSAGYKYGKQIRGLENYMESNILYLEAQKDQADLEKSERKQLPGGITYKEMNDKIYDGYLNNNLDAMDSFMVYQYESEAFADKFIKQRNYNQADSIDYYIKTGKAVFAAVGSAHLPGAFGVIEILRKKGYTLRPVTLKFTNTNELEAVKKTIIPLQNSDQNVDNIIQVKTPGVFYPYEKTDILKSYGYVDMANSSFYYISRLYNNAAYFNYDNKKLSLAIDSLLFSNIKGDIVEKSFSQLDGYACVNVTTKVKNKDVERYKFVITPYEIIKFYVGGKNEFAKASFVDEFFNSIKIAAPTQLSEQYGVTFKNKLPTHIWDINGGQNLLSKQRFSQYDSTLQQLNSCIKIRMEEGKLYNDSLLSHVIRESFLSSEMFPKTHLYDAKIFPLANNNIVNIALASGQSILVKYKINFPYIYLLSSLRAKEPSADFINSFELKDYTLTTKKEFIDTSRGFKVMLPYALSFDNNWKYQKERKRKTYDDNKKPNDYSNIFYSPEKYGNGAVKNKFIFEDVTNLETVELQTIKFDKDSYYSNATSFWDEIVEPYKDVDEDKISDYEEDQIFQKVETSNFLAKNTKSNNVKKTSNFNVFDDDTKLEKIVYDTANNDLQTIAFYVTDSIKNKRTYHQYKLTNDKLYHLSFIQFNKDKTAFQKMILESFSPIQNNKKIQIFTSNFNTIINDYLNADLKKRPNVLKRLNNLFLGVKDLPTVNEVFGKHNKNTTENNILRRKLIGMLTNGLTLNKKTDWPKISNWLRAIFENENELATIRAFALSSIISNEDNYDADWLLKNLYKKNAAYQKNASIQLVNYFKKTKKKETLIPKLPLIFKDINDRDDAKNLELIDSGYYNITEKQHAFDLYKKKLEDEILNIKLSQEKNGFEFKESDINETLSGNQNRSNFRALVKGFSIFYNLNPTDIFFEDAFKKILSSKSDKDLLNILEVFLKSTKPDYSKIDKIVAEVGKSNDNNIELNKIFFKQKKYEKLPTQYKDKNTIAKYFLLQERTYNKLDSLSIIGVVKYPYNNTDSVYFFKYLENKEKNASVAYVILDSKNEFLKKNPTIEFTREQITTAEPFEKVVKKLMQKRYTNSYFFGRANYYDTNNNSKMLYSEE